MSETNTTTDVTEIETTDKDLIEQLRIEKEQVLKDFEDIKSKQQGSDRAAQKYKAELDKIKAEYEKTLGQEERDKLEAQRTSERLANLEKELDDERTKRSLEQLESYRVSSIINNELDKIYSVMINGKSKEEIDLQIVEAKKLQELNRQASVNTTFTQTAPTGQANDVTITKEKFKNMSLMDRQQFAKENPDDYKKLRG